MFVLCIVSTLLLLAGGKSLFSIQVTDLGREVAMVPDTVRQKPADIREE